MVILDVPNKKVYGGLPVLGDLKGNGIDTFWRMNVDTDELQCEVHIDVEGCYIVLKSTIPIKPIIKKNEEKVCVEFICNPWTASVDATKTKADAKGYQIYFDDNESVNEAFMFDGSSEVKVLQFIFHDVRKDGEKVKGAFSSIDVRIAWDVVQNILLSEKEHLIRETISELSNLADLSMNCVNKLKRLRDECQKAEMVKRQRGENVSSK